MMMLANSLLAVRSMTGRATGIPLLVRLIAATAVEFRLRLDDVNKMMFGRYVSSVSVVVSILMTSVCVCWDRE